jgi:3D (Asp-Asp-Asp) domain-containing protein
VFNVNTGTLTTTTAYTSHVEQTDSEPCVSADGSDICKLYAAGQLVCASNAYPLGSTLYVDGYGECVVADRMNKRYNKRVDVYFGYDRARALNWGKRNVLVLKIN